MAELARQGKLWATAVQGYHYHVEVRLHDELDNPRGRKARYFFTVGGGDMKRMTPRSELRRVLERAREQYGARSRILELREAEEGLSFPERPWRDPMEWTHHVRDHIRAGKAQGVVGWNPDPRLRHLERQAAAGDYQAEKALRRARERLSPSPEQQAVSDALRYVGQLHGVWRGQEDKIAPDELIESAVFGLIEAAARLYYQDGIEQVMFSKNRDLAWAYEQIALGATLESVYEKVVTDTIPGQIYNGHSVSVVPLKAGGYNVIAQVYFRARDEDELEHFASELEDSFEDRDQRLVERSDMEWDPSWDMEARSEGDDLGELDAVVTLTRPLELYHLLIGVGEYVHVAKKPTSSKKKRRKRRRSR